MKLMLDLGIFLRQFGRKGTVLLDFILERDLSDDMEDFEDIQLYRRIYGVSSHCHSLPFTLLIIHLQGNRHRIVFRQVFSGGEDS